MKKLSTIMVLAMVILFGAICTPTVASAADASTRTYVSVYRDGTYVDVVCWYEESGSFYLESYQDLKKVFPTETANTYYTDASKAALGPYVRKFGYSMTLESGNKLLLTKNGSSGGDVSVPTTPLEVYKNGKKISVQAWMDEAGKIYLADYTALKTLFPDETANVQLPTVVEPVELAPYAEKYGYDLIKAGTYLNVNKKDNGEVTVPRTTLEVYKNGKKVDVKAWAEEDGTIYLADYSALKTLFPDETQNVQFPTVVEPVALAKYAKDYGYDLIRAGTYLNVNKKDNGEVTVPRTTLEVYKNDKKVNVTAWQYEDGKITLANYTALKTLFPDETSNLVLPTDQTEVELKPFITQFGYDYSIKNKILYLSKSENESTPNPDNRLTVYRDQTKVDVTIWKDSYTGKLYISSFKELYKLFPTETEKLAVPKVEGAVLVAQYADMFGYTMELGNGKVTFNQIAPTGTKNIEIWINGEKLVIPDNVPAPYVTAGTTFVPMRAVSERLGAQVEWFRAVPHDIVTVNREGVNVIIKVGSTEYTVNGVKHKLLAAPEYKSLNGNTSTMLPLRAVAESFGASVDWLGRLNRVIIMDDYLF